MAKKEGQYKGHQPQQEEKKRPNGCFFGQTLAMAEAELVNSAILVFGMVQIASMRVRQDGESRQTACQRHTNDQKTGKKSLFHAFFFARRVSSVVASIARRIDTQK